MERKTHWSLILTISKKITDAKNKCHQSKRIHFVKMHVKTLKRSVIKRTDFGLITFRNSFCVTVFQFIRFQNFDIKMLNKSMFG